MTTIQTVAAFMEQLAPARLAEDWDNVGLLVGDRSRPVERLTEESRAYAGRPFGTE